MKIEKIELYDILILATFALFSIVRIEPAPFDVLILLALLIGFFATKLDFKRVFIFSITNLLIWLFIIGTLISIYFAKDFSLAIFYSGITFYLILLFYFIKSYITSRKRARIILFGWTFSGILAAFLGLIGYLRLTPIWDYFIFGFNRPMALFKDPDVFAPFFVPLVLWILYEIIKPTLWKSHKLLKIFLLYFFVLAIIFSSSRGAWLNLWVGLFFFISIFSFFIPKIKIAQKIKLFSFVGLILLTFLISFYVFPYLRHRVGLESYDVTRFEKQTEALKLSVQAPFGIGSGQTTKTINYATHSLYLRIFLEGGWFTFLIFITFLFYWGLKMFKYSLRNKVICGISSLVIFVSFMGILAQSFFIDTLHWRHFWLILGIGAVMIYVDRMYQRKTPIIQ